MLFSPVGCECACACFVEFPSCLVQLVAFSELSGTPVGRGCGHCLGGKKYMVCNCCVCNKEIRKEFIYFCHGCYRSYLYRLKITNQDFINYINLNFNCDISFNSYYCFKNI